MGIAVRLSRAAALAEPSQYLIEADDDENYRPKYVGHRERYKAGIRKQKNQPQNDQKKRG
jgi:hypothetical protein